MEESKKADITLHQFLLGEGGLTQSNDFCEANYGAYKLPSDELLLRYQSAHFDALRGHSSIATSTSRRATEEQASYVLRESSPSIIAETLDRISLAVSRAKLGKFLENQIKRLQAQCYKSTARTGKLEALKILQKEISAKKKYGRGDLQAWLAQCARLCYLSTGFWGCGSVTSWSGVSGYRSGLVLWNDDLQQYKQQMVSDQESRCTNHQTPLLPK